MPFVVMKKKKVLGEGNNNEELNIANGETPLLKYNDQSPDFQVQSSIGTSYEVAAIIKKKIIFSEYPNAIIR